MGQRTSSETATATEGISMFRSVLWPFSAVFFLLSLSSSLRAVFSFLWRFHNSLIVSLSLVSAFANGAQLCVLRNALVSLVSNSYPPIVVVVVVVVLFHPPLAATSVPRLALPATVMAPYISTVGNAGGWSHVYGRKGTSNAPFPSLPSSLAYASRRNIRFLRYETSEFSSPNVAFSSPSVFRISIQFCVFFSSLKTLSPSFNFFVFFRIVSSF